MKTFNDLEVGDCFYDLDVYSRRIYRNKITKIESEEYGKLFVWTDNNDCPGRTLITRNRLNLTVVPDTFCISCISIYDIINILCNS